MGHIFEGYSTNMFFEIFNLTYACGGRCLEFSVLEILSELHFFFLNNIDTHISIETYLKFFITIL